jgi:membrane fusion protein (multidrug efflux system)
MLTLNRTMKVMPNFVVNLVRRSPNGNAPLNSGPRWIASALLLVAVLGAGTGLAVWKAAALRGGDGAAAHSHEPAESVTVAVAREREHRRTTTSIGTVLALRSITLRNELPGTVRQVALTPGQVVEAGTVLVALDVSVEEAELKAQQAQAALAETLLARVQNAVTNRAISQMEVDRARAERDVALAQIARTRAIIERKTIRAPFRARVGMADVHPGQFLEEGALLTTLQGVDDAVHVDFNVPQTVAAALRDGDSVDVFAHKDAAATPARIVAIDARVDPVTRNATIRARIEGRGDVPVPGASVRVQTPVGPAELAVAVPVSAQRKGPGGDHVFVIAPDQKGQPRAHVRPVRSGAMLGDEVLILEGLAAGDRVAASGSFKLREAVLVAFATNSDAAGPGGFGGTN